jgi:hypothetical protein
VRVRWGLNHRTATHRVAPTLPAVAQVRMNHAPFRSYGIGARHRRGPTCRAYSRVRCTKEHRGRAVAWVVGAVREPPLQPVEPKPVVGLPGSAAGCPGGITPHGGPTGSPIWCAACTAAGLADAAPKCTAVSGRRTASPLHCRWGAGSCEPRAFSFVWYRGTAPPCPYVPRVHSRMRWASEHRKHLAAPVVGAVREPPLQCPAMLRRNPWCDRLGAGRPHPHPS